MATIKQLLEKAMLKVGCVAGLPSLSPNDGINIAYGDNPPTTYKNYTAPADGFFVLGGRFSPAVNGKMRCTSGDIGGNKMFVSSTCYPTKESGGQATIFVPARKGTTITYFWSHYMDVIELCKFIKSIGGG